MDNNNRNRRLERMLNPRPNQRPRRMQQQDTCTLMEDERRSVKIQFEKDNNNNNLGSMRFDRLLREYCRFMSLKVQGPHVVNTLAPSYLIDKMWHAHILSTRAYHAFCQRYSQGRYIHHDPTMRHGQDRYQRTLDAYADRFGSPPTDRTIWPLRVDQRPLEEQQQQRQPRVIALDYVRREFPGSFEGQLESMKAYLEAHGGERGLTQETLQEWHEEAILDPNVNEGMDPRLPENAGVYNCENNHRWYDGDFDLCCESCRESSSGIGGISCG